MRHNSAIIQTVKTTQERIFRLAKRDHGLTLKAISMDAGIDYDSLCNYAKGETQMPVSALVSLIGVVPDELLSLLLPDGRLIVCLPENVDFDEVAEWAEQFSARKLAAHRADSECEERIGPNETNELKSIVVAFPGSVAG